MGSVSDFLYDLGQSLPLPLPWASLRHPSKMSAVPIYEVNDTGLDIVQAPESSSVFMWRFFLVGLLLH